MGVIVGLDPSLTSTGIVAGEKPGDFSAFICSSRKHGDTIADRFRRYGLLLDEVEGVLRKLDIEAVYIEGYAFAASGRAVFTGEYGGLLRSVIYTHCDTIVEVAPARLKLFATGRGRFKAGEGKAPMIAAVSERWGYEANCSDDADAFALWRFGLCCRGRAEAITAEQHAAVEAVNNPKPKRKRAKRKAAERPSLF